MVIEWDSDGIYVANVPALPGCHTQAHSLDTLKERMRDAIALHLDEVEPSAGNQVSDLRKFWRTSWTIGTNALS